MAASLTERLQLVVDATTGAAETRFAKLGDAASDTAAKARATGNEVAAAADRVAQARLREQDASGRVSVAEVRLQELRDSGRAKASQVAAAEERVATAKRQHELAAHGLSRATIDQATVQGRATDELDRGTRSAGAMRGAMVGLASGAAAFVGLNLVGTLRGVADEFVNGARGAGQLATSMNASIGEAGQLLGLVGSLGLDLNDLLEIQAEFAQKVGANGKELNDLGVTIDRNANGTVNWATTLENTLAVLQDIPDATERNRLGFQYFGEEGYKQLSRLVNSGVSVRDALERIGTPFSEADVAAAADYDNAMMEMSLTGERLERTIGRAVIPILSDFAGGVDDVLAVITAVPAPIALATIAAIALGVTGFSPTAVAGARLAVVMAAVRTEVAVASATMIQGGAAAGALGAGLAGAGAAGRGMVGLLGGPLGVGLIGVATAAYLVRDGVEAFEQSVQDALPRLAELQRQGSSLTSSIAQTARELQSQAGFMESAAAGAEGVSTALDGAASPLAAYITGLVSADAQTLGYAERLRQAAAEVGAFAQQQADSQLATKGLNDLIAEGTTGGADFATAVQAAADGQARQAETSGLAEAAIAAYNAVTRDAVDVTLGLINAELSRNDANYAFLDSADAVRGAVDDEKTSVDEVAQAHNRLQQAALSAAGAAADAAVSAATANGTVLTDLAEAQIRADAVIADLQSRLNTPGLGDAARAEIQGIIDRLVTAKDNGTIEATLQTVGVGEATSELDAAAEDRDTTIAVESRNGPAVVAYLDGIATTTRLAEIRVESRNGPAVVSYLDGIARADRLALIRVESRNGPAVAGYLDSLTRERLAIIRVESRGGPAVDSYLDGLANQSRVAVISSRAAPSGAAPGPTGAAMRGAPGGLLATAGAGGGYQFGSVTLDLELTGTVDRSKLASADRGRAAINDIRAYEQQNGTSWRRKP